MEIPNKSNGEHYNLRWNSYTNNLIQVLLEHQHHENLVDVTLCCEGQFVKAHKLVLSACSEVFQDMFKVHNVQHPVIILNGIKFKHFKYILEFIYQGEVKVLDIDLEGVLALGENLQVKGLSSIKLKQQVSTEELKTTALNRSSNNKEYNPKSLPTSPALNNQHVLNFANNIQPKPKDLTSTNRPSANDLKNPLLRKYQSDGQTQADFKKVQTGNSNLSTDGSKNISKLESILTDPNEKVQRKRFKRTEKPSGVSNGGSVDSTNNENIKDTEKNSRPANAFMIFANEWRKKLKVEHPEENNKAISVKLGDMWKSLSNETKQCYYLAARKMEMDQNTKDLESISKNDSKRKKVARRKTIDSISHLVSVDLQEFDDDDDDLQIIEVKEDPIDVSHFPAKRNRSTESSNKT